MNTIETLNLPIDVRASQQRFDQLDETHRPQSSEVFLDKHLSGKYQANVWIVSDAHQETGAYKERGAINKVAYELENNSYEQIVTVSSGNHAAAVAKAARIFRLPATIFVPETTPKTKIDNILAIGQEFVEIEITGQTFDDAAESANQKIEENDDGVLFVHPFDDPLIASGQGTIMEEVQQKIGANIDFLAVPVGGGGLLSGIMNATKNQAIHYLAVEPLEASSLLNNLVRPDHNLKTIDTFIDGAAVKKVGKTVLDTISDCQLRGEDFSLIRPNRNDTRRATTYYWEDLGQTSQCRESNERILPELAGALSTAALKYMGSSLVGKTVVCVVSGGNLGQERYHQEVKLLD